MPPSSSKIQASSNASNITQSTTTNTKDNIIKESSLRNRKLSRHKTITSTPSRFARFSSGLGANTRKIGVLNTSAESIFNPNKEAQQAANNNTTAPCSNIQKVSAPSDLNEITPFGGLRTGNILHRNSWKTNRPGGSSNRWPFLHWSHRKQSPSNTCNLPQEPVTREERHTVASKHPSGVGYSLLSGRKSKNRHISCPDISSASSESSRSTSPTSFKSSLTSLFHRTQSSPSTITTTSSTANNSKNSASVMSRPLMVSSGSNILQRRGSNHGKRSGHKLYPASTSQQSLSKTPSPNKGNHCRKEVVLSIDVQEHHSSISDENEMLQATVSYCDVPDAYDNYLADHSAATEAESLYAGAIEQVVAGKSVNTQQLYSEHLSPHELHEIER